jgi:hypothetical protein
MRTDGVWRRRRLLTAVGVGFLLIFGAGCAAEPIAVPTSAAPTPAPAFASDEEALAAATEAYARYQEMADEITGDGGNAPERIAPFVSETYLPVEVHQYDDYRVAQARSVGRTSFAVASAQQLDYGNADNTSIALYICDDVSGIDVLDKTGASLVTESRVEVTPFEVGFVLNRDGLLVVDSRDVWESESFC